ncbi:MAG: GerMN domain-containing protein [Patescibacteria group bacterium]|jgi:hypothetical protein
MSRTTAIIILVLFFALALLFGFGNRLSENSNNLASPTTTPSLQTTVTPSPTTRQTINVYLVRLGGNEDDINNPESFGCGDFLIPIERQIEPTQAVLEAAFNELLSLKEQFVNRNDSRLYNALYQSSLNFDRATVDNGLATVYLTGTLASGGTCDDPRIEEQLTATALQFSTVNETRIFINDESIENVLSQRN